MPTGLLTSFRLLSKEEDRSGAVTPQPCRVALPGQASEGAGHSRDCHLTSCRTHNQEERTLLLVTPREIQASVLGERKKAPLRYSAENFAGGETEARDT